MTLPSAYGTIRHTEKTKVDMTDKETIIVALKEEIRGNSLQIEQLSEDVRGLMYAVRDLAEAVELNAS